MKTTTKMMQIIIVTILLVIVGTIYVYDPFSSGNKVPLSLSYYQNVGIFRIAPETIFSSLNRGDTDVFLPNSRSVDDRFEGPILYDDIGWSQSETLTIVHALDNYIWKGTLDNWRLSFMTFDVDCQDDLGKLSIGRFRYFMTTFYDGKIIDLWREVEVNSEYGFVAWGDGAKSKHPIFGRASIDMERLKVTAKDAIRIAEEHGGRDARLNVQNQCSIYLALAPKGDKKGWWVSYNTSEIFEILIDPYTGEIIKQDH